MTRTAALRRWACRILDAPAGATGAALRGAVYARLRDADFAPPPAWHEAVRALTAGDGDGKDFRWEDWPAYRADLEDELLERVEALGRDYFSIPVAARRLLWLELWTDSEPTPPLRSRLRALQAGLDVSREEIESGTGDERELARLAARLLVLPPSERVLERRRAVESLRLEAVRWEGAAQSLRRESPELAGMAPELMAELADFSQASAVKFQRSKERQKDEARRQRRASWATFLEILRRPQVAPPSNQKPMTRRQWAYVAVGLLVVLPFYVWLLSYLSSRSRTSNRYAGEPAQYSQVRTWAPTQPRLGSLPNQLNWENRVPIPLTPEQALRFRQVPPEELTARLQWILHGDPELPGAGRADRPDPVSLPEGPDEVELPDPLDPARVQLYSSPP